MINTYFFRNHFGNNQRTTLDLINRIRKIEKKRQKGKNLQRKSWLKPAKLMKKMTNCGQGCSWCPTQKYLQKQFLCFGISILKES